MEGTKVQIGDDCLLDLGVNSEWYISTLCYDNESVNVELRRKADRYSEWWRAEQTKPQTCEECEHWNDTEDGCADRHGCKTEPQTEILAQIHELYANMEKLLRKSSAEIVGAIREQMEKGKTNE